jgi:hypothetical protein
MSRTSCDARMVSGNHLLVHKERNDKEDDHPIVTLVTRSLGGKHGRYKVNHRGSDYRPLVVDTSILR